MKATVSNLRWYAREPQTASACRIHSSKRVRRVATSPLVPPWSGWAATVLAREASGTSNTPAPGIALWRLALAGSATDRVEMLAFLLLALGSAVSLLNGFWRLDYFLVNWPSFVELIQCVFS